MHNNLRQSQTRRSSAHVACGQLDLSWFTVNWNIIALEVREQIDAAQNMTENRYDDLYRLVLTIDAEDGETEFGYDAVGNRLSLTDPEGNKTQWVFDGLDRMTQETNELGNTRIFFYDDVNNIVETRDRNGRVREFDYDKLYRLEEERWLAAGTLTLERTLSVAYDAASQLTAASDPDGAYRFVYDDLGMVTLIYNSDEFGDTRGQPDVVLDPEYDAVDRMTFFSATVNGVADFTNSYSYDVLNRLERIDQSGTTGGNTVSDKSVSFGYNAIGQFTDIDRYSDLGQTQMVAASSYGYDSLARLTSLVHTDGDMNPVASYGWGYDRLNRITTFTSSNENGGAGGESGYQYDPTYQLTDVTSDISGAEDYDYLWSVQPQTGHFSGESRECMLGLSC